MSHSAEIAPPVRPRRTFGVRQIVILAIVGFWLLVMLIAGFARLRAYSIPNDSMAPTLLNGDRILMERLAYLWRTPARGDLVVFETKGLGGMYGNNRFVKRVVGEPGDALRLVDGKLYINNVESHLMTATGEVRYAVLPMQKYLASTNETLVVPEGKYFVIGDNTANSLDSRIFGPIAADTVRGRIFFRWFPVARFGTVH